jgi:hypothetical protein
MYLGRGSREVKFIEKDGKKELWRAYVRARIRKALTNMIARGRFGECA